MKVYLVGAGPGHPGLLTAAAIRVLAEADVVVYDRLLSPRILGFAPKTARFVYVGKEAGRHAMQQERINLLLVEKALEGQKVVRLKGGDPFVFGRGGEEAAACQEAGVPFEVVPGVTSPVAVSAFAGIPVTHRSIATSFSVVTGHLCDSEQVDTRHPLDCTALAKSKGTLVVLMGVSQLDLLVRRLLESGRELDTPIALIRWGTRAEQQTLTGTLASICQQVKEAGFQPPAIIIVGEVVTLRETLAWFEKKPLMGKRILIAADTLSQGRKMAEAVEAFGAEAMDISMEQGVFLQSFQVQRILEKPASMDTDLLFTSVQGVHSFFASLRVLQVDWRRLVGYRLGALNEEVAQTLMEYGIHVDFIGVAERILYEPRVDVVRYDSGVLTETYRLQDWRVDTPQFQAMWDACNAPFDAIWAASSEAFQFMEQVERHCESKYLPAPTRMVQNEVSRGRLLEMGVLVDTASTVEDVVQFMKNAKMKGVTW